MRISRNSRQCIPHSPPLHRLLPVALVGVTGLLSDAHFSPSAEPHAHVGLTFQSLSAICPQATPQVHGLTTSQTCRSSGLTAPQATSYKLLSQLASLRSLLVHLECSPLLPELFHTRKVQFKCSFLQEVFCNCPIVTNPSSRQP